MPDKVPERTTVEALWRQYRDACYPAKNGPLPPIQEVETRQAFFAGALISLKVILDSVENMPEEEAMQNIVNMCAEVEAVCRQSIYHMKNRN